MNKARFFKICDSARYGKVRDGDRTYDLPLEVVVSSDLDSNWAVRVNGHFKHTQGWAIETVSGQKTVAGILSARDRCLAKLPKYRRWLQEWKARNSERMYVYDDDFNLQEE